MKKHIKKALQWALSKFEPDPAEIAAWPFPVSKVSEDFEPRLKKKAPSLKKATTRTVAKKATKVAKKAK
jgi:predicted component of type VI protein secretion system